MERNQREEQVEKGSPVLPSVTYHQLVSDPTLFHRQLTLFHSSPPPSTPPSLDLHRLFVDVTSRGGLLQVIKDRKWKDVVSGFESSCSSFVLRKYYVSLLYAFEQLYFFRNPTSSPPPQLSTTSNPLHDDSTPLHNSSSSNPGTTHIPPGISFIGVIDEKFDNGYVVSVNVGSGQLKGILYHIPETPQPSPLKLIGKPHNFSTGRFAPLTPISQGHL